MIKSVIVEVKINSCVEFFIYENCTMIISNDSVTVEDKNEIVSFLLLDVLSVDIKIK